MVRIAPVYFYGNQLLITIASYSTAVCFVKPLAKKGKLYFRIINSKSRFFNFKPPT